MFRKSPFQKYRASATPAVVTRLALTPLTRERVRLIGVALETDPHRVNPNRLYVGVQERFLYQLATGESVEHWGRTKWLDLARYRDLLTEEEAAAWLAHGFAPAANDPE